MTADVLSILRAHSPGYLSSVDVAIIGGISRNTARYQLKKAFDTHPDIPVSRSKGYGWRWTRNEFAQREGAVFLSDISAVEHLTFRQRVILRDLLENSFCTRNRLIDQIWMDDPDPPLGVENILKLYIHNIRRWLYEGWVIRLEWGQGYRLEHT